MKTQLRTSIVEMALDMFKTQGIKRVKMDDIAHSLVISKRTLYEVFADKEALLLECVKVNTELLEQQRIEYAKHAENMMDILVFYIRQQLEELSKCNQRFIVEAVRYATVQNYLIELRERDRALHQRFLLKGIRYGYFVADINYELLERIGHMTAMNLIAEKVYEDYSLQDIFQTFTLVFLRGILTEKGIVNLNKFFNKV